MNLEIDFPRWAALPSIPLYMDQVLIVLEETLRPLTDSEEPVVTQTMINNYVKQKLAPAPVKKKYTRRHIAALIMVSTFKRALSMPEIDGVLSLLYKEYGEQGAYDLFCGELEGTLRSARAQSIAIAVSQPATAKSLLNAALLALLGKLLVQQGLLKTETETM